MKRVLLVTLLLIAQPSYSVDANRWLELIGSGDEVVEYAALTYLQGILDTVRYHGMSDWCANVPPSATPEQLKAVVIKYLEDQPQIRHADMPVATGAALVANFGYSPTDDEGFCPDR